jgi:hypothetical protein
MIVLTMQLKRFDDSDVKIYELRLYCTATVVTIAICLAVFIDTLLSLLCIPTSKDCLQTIIARDPDHNIITGCLFLLLTLGMIASVVPLFLAIRALRQKAVVLAKQIHTLVLIFSVFSISYLAVTVFDFALKTSADFINVLIGTLLDFLVDFTPLLMMFCFHLSEVQRVKRD